jgi:outer membrane immunogenic protein
MRKTLIGVTAIVALIGTPALAADMPVKAPPPPPPAPVFYSWTGFYVGGNFGGGWEHSDWTGSTIVTPLGLTGTQIFAFSQNASGVLGGGQVGLNYQLPSNFVVSIEADIDGSGIRGSTGFCSTNVSPVLPAGLFGNCVSTSSRLNAFGTARGRLGYAFNNLLLYGTGGFAWGESSTSSFLTCNGEPGPSPKCSGPGGGVPFTGGATSGSATFAGWAAGAGAEWRFRPNWSLRLEYVHLQFNGIRQSFSTSGTFLAPIVGPFGATSNTRTNAGVDIVRVGLNYMVNWGAPLATRY